MTKFCRRVEFQMFTESSRTIVSDSELRIVLASIRQELPDIGGKMVLGRLRSLGYHVTRGHIRQAIRDTIPLIPLSDGKVFLLQGDHTRYQVLIHCGT